MKRTLLLCTFSLLASATLTPHLAWGKTASMGGEISPAFWVVMSVAIVTSIIALWSILRRKDAIIRANEAEAIVQFSDAVLEEGSMAYFTIHNGETCYCSPRLRRWLGLSNSIISLDNLESIVFEVNSDNEVVASLLGKIRTLVDNGTGFTSTFNPPKLDRIYLVRGNRAENDINKNRQFDVVWFSNVTELDQGHSNLAEKLSQATSRQTMLEEILKDAPFPVWARNNDLSLGWVNQPYADAVEKKNNKSVIESQAELVIDSNERPLQQIAKKALEEGGEVKDKHFVIIDGERRSLQIHEVPFESPNFATVGFAVDVTKAEFLSAELDQHKAAHAETLDKLSSPVAIFGPDTSLMFYNQAFGDLWRLPSKWLNGEPTHSELLEALREKKQLPEQADFPAWKKHILSRYTGLLEPTEDTWHLPNGSSLRVVTQPHPIGGILVLFEDVTDRLALERSYNTLIEVQRETLDNLHEAVAVFGSDGKLKLFNANYAKLWQVDQEFLKAEPHINEVMGKNKKYLSNEYQSWEQVKKELRNITSSRENHSGQWTLTDGTVVEYSIVPLPDGASLFTISDETSKVKITAALEDRNKAMQEADRIKSEFIANMSYELRTPLNSIIGFSEILNLENYGSLNEQQKDYINAILSSSIKLKYLIDDILDLSIIEAGKMDLDIEPMTLKEAAIDAIKISQEAAANKQVRITLEEDDAQATDLDGDQRRITQAINTVISESINRTEKNGEINIKLNDYKYTVSVTITDHKEVASTSDDDSELIGIATNNGAKKQLSLGLSLVDSFVKIHGGTQTIEVDKNGTRSITCSFPRKHTLQETGK